jgi:NAD(P)H-hydrate epimerase
MGVPPMVLMERAGLSVVEELTEDGSFDLSRALCVCGAGNNGGDGFAVARLLNLKGIAADALFVGEAERLTKETKLQMQIAGNYGIRTETNIGAAESIGFGGVYPKITV